jgi:ornithine--oxo-acid transaminase|tara:strand:- start:1 stop:153 length:153 start_codon:yes stop_codon:yes gene_type:complete
LLTCDEVKTGLGLTGKMLVCEQDDVHPETLILGKALDDDMLAVSLLLARQ